jgi:predicted MPP superfamily phosphohydrolase
MTNTTKRIFAVVIGIAAAIGIAVAWWSRFVHPFQTQLVHVIMPVARKHARLDGLTIGFVSDIHIGPHFHPDALRPTIDYLRKVQPDVLIFGGDYISESPRFVDSIVDPLEDMAATARHGAWAVLGNHDVANAPARVEAALERAGIAVLVNRSAEVTTAKGPIWLVGIDDALLGAPDLARAFAGIPADAPMIAIWHEPDRASEIVPFDPLFMLSGHTHGGQVRVPGLTSVATPKLGKRFVIGRHDIEGMPLYVSPGIGMYRPPVRFNCPPEVVVITLLGDGETGAALPA